MAKAAIVLESDFEDSEFETPLSELRDHGHTVEVVGTEKGKELTGKRGNVTYTTELGIDDARPDAYDVLVVPGGYSPDKLRTDDRVVEFTRAFMDAGKPVAAICHAGSLLIETGTVSGRRLTSWPSIKTDLLNAGAEWVDDEVVVDGNLITSRNPGDLPAFCKQILSTLESTGG